MSLSYADSPDAISFIVSELIRMKVKLTEWEVEFIESIDIQLARGHSLSAKQKQKLSDMWEKY